MLMLRGLTKRMLLAHYRNTIFYSDNPRFYPTFSWESKNRQAHPHIMFTIKHDLTGDERLLRGEVLSILATM